MRNPKRIKDMMSLLTEIWEMHPDVRFNQLITHLQNEYGDQESLKRMTKDKFIDLIDADMFYVEDDKFLEFLQNYYHDLQNRM